MNSCIFWNITPCSSLEVNRCFGGTCGLYLLDRKVTQARNGHKHKSSRGSETSIDFQRTTRRYIPEDRSLNTFQFINLKMLQSYYMGFEVFTAVEKRLWSSGLEISLTSCSLVLVTTVLEKALRSFSTFLLKII
jgi:hypothetical protein